MPVRRAGTWVMVVLSWLLALSTCLAWWASGLADAETFAAQATAALGEDEVNQLVAERLVDRYANDTVLGTSARPAAVAVTRSVISSDEFAGVFQSAVRTAHEQLVSDRDDSVTVAVAGAAPLLEPVLDDSGSSDSPPPSSGVLAVVDDPALVRAAHVLSVMDTLAWACAAGWLLASAVAVMLATDRRRTIRRLGFGLFVAGLVLVAGVAVGRAAAGHGEPADVRAAAGATVTVFTATLRRLGLVIALLGAVVAICAATAPPSGAGLAHSTANQMRSVANWPLARAGSPVVALVLGLCLLLEPLDTLAVLAEVTGLLLLGGAVVTLVGWLVRAIDRGPDPATPQATQTIGATALTAVIAVLLVTAAAAGAVVARDSDPALPAPDPDGAGCNGMIGLCDLQLDQVALVGTHNSMSSSAERGWYLAEQRLSVIGQLAAGVRTMMLDVYPGYVSEGRVRTDLRAPHTADAAEADLTDEGRAALEHLGITVGAIPPEDAVIEAYLCHAYCELGASKMVDKLRDVGDFLDHNPNEVMVIVLQDYITGAETQEVFEDARLLERVWPLEAPDPWPTLRQMIEARRNILVLSENHGGEVTWMPAAYGVMEETPYEFTSPADFSCVPNRGGTGKTEFLVNHWIREQGSKPLEDAEVANSRKTLTARLDDCRQVRDREPGIVAVDFVDVGDAIAVVGDLNQARVGQ
jgi:hypothetical protein